MGGRSRGRTFYLRMADACLQAAGRGTLPLPEEKPRTDDENLGPP
jgi:hypothetical protein